MFDNNNNNNNNNFSICFLGEDVVATCSSRLSNPQDVQENKKCKLKNKKGKVLKEDKRGKGKKVEKTKSKVDNSTTFAPSYNLLQILSNEPTCSKYWDDEDVCSSGEETVSIRALRVSGLCSNVKSLDLDFHNLQAKVRMRNLTKFEGKEKLRTVCI